MILLVIVYHNARFIAICQVTALRTPAPLLSTLTYLYFCVYDGEVLAYRKGRRCLYRQMCAAPK